MLGRVATEQTSQTQLTLLTDEQSNLLEKIIQIYQNPRRQFLINFNKYFKKNNSEFVFPHFDDYNALIKYVMDKYKLKIIPGKGKQALSVYVCINEKKCIEVYGGKTYRESLKRKRESDLIDGPMQKHQRTNPNVVDQRQNLNTQQFNTNLNIQDDQQPGSSSSAIQSSNVPIDTSNEEERNKLLRKLNRYYDFLKDTTHDKKRKLRTSTANILSEINNTDGYRKAQIGCLKNNFDLQIKDENNDLLMIIKDKNMNKEVKLVIWEPTLPSITTTNLHNNSAITEANTTSNSPLKDVTPDVVPTSSNYLDNNDLDVSLNLTPSPSKPPQRTQPLTPSPSKPPQRPQSLIPSPMKSFQMPPANAPIDTSNKEYLEENVNVDNTNRVIDNFLQPDSENLDTSLSLNQKPQSHMNSLQCNEDERFLQDDPFAKFVDQYSQSPARSPLQTNSFISGWINQDDIDVLDQYFGEYIPTSPKLS